MTAQQEQEYHIHISARHKWSDLKLKEVWQYRDLILLFTIKAYTVRYKQTILGPLWLIINPIVSALMYTIVFGEIAKLSTDGVPKILFYMTGNAIWGYFASCLNNNSSTFVSNARLFGKVYFPRLTIPVSNVLSAVIHWMIQMVLLCVFLFYFLSQGLIQPHFTAWLYIPFILIHLGIMGMSCGLMISSFTTKYRDLSSIFGFGVTLWMYATPVIYPLSQLPEGFLRNALLWNPITAPIELFRYAVLGVGTIRIECFVVSWIFTAVVFVVGLMLFHRVERNFMDTV